MKLEKKSLCARNCAHFLILCERAARLCDAAGPDEILAAEKPAFARAVRAIILPAIGASYTRRTFAEALRRPLGPRRDGRGE